MRVLRKLIWFTVVFFTATWAAIAEDPPNIVLVLADDLGWSDVACYGADLIETPHIDALAAKSVRFTQAYAPAPVCSPTRAAILTGQAPSAIEDDNMVRRCGATGPKNRRLLQGASQHDLPLSELTLAEHFQSAGYLTALIGKWHLGDAAHAPETQGFDINIGGTHWGAPSTFFFPYRGARRDGEVRYVPDLELGTPGEYLTDRLTQEADRVIRHAANANRPFFLMLAHHAPHTPIEAKKTDVEYFAKRRTPELRHQNPIYAAMVRSLDDSVGKLRQCLKEVGVADNTVFIFTSDNGGYIGTSEFEGTETPITDNWPLRSGKGTCYEGGLRVPLIVHLPVHQKSHIECRGTRDQPVVLTDLFHTLIELLPTPPSPSVTDGLNLLPLLRDEHADLKREALYFHYPHYYHAPQSTPVSAIRSGQWKLLEYFEDSRVELYDLDNDPSESMNMAGEYPEAANRLRQSLQSWLKETDASMPTINAGNVSR